MLFFIVIGLWADKFGILVENWGHVFQNCSVHVQAKQRTEKTFLRDFPDHFRSLTKQKLGKHQKI